MRRVFDWLAGEAIPDPARGATSVHLGAAACGLGTTLAVNFGWSVARFGVIRGPLVAIGSGLLAYWLSFILLQVLAAGLLALALHLGWYAPEAEGPRRVSREEDPT